mgnify:CR=1 FL=1
MTSLAAPEGERVGALFASAGVVEAREISAAQSRDLGRLAGMLHATVDGGNASYARPPIDEDALIDAPLAATRGAIAGGDDLAFLETVAERVRHRLSELPRGAPDYGYCHGDLHPGNVRFDTSGQPTLFDFDFCGDGWRAYDLAVFLWNTFGERRPRRWRESRWRAFLRGYREVRPLPEGLDEAVPLFLAARQIWFIGLDFGGNGGWLPQWLTPQYLQEQVLPLRRWTSEYAILRG